MWNMKSNNLKYCKKKKLHVGIVTSIVYDLYVRTENRVITVTVCGLEIWNSIVGMYKQYFSPSRTTSKSLH